MRYDVVTEGEHRRCSSLDFEKKPILGAMLHNDSHNVIIGVNNTTRRVRMAPRITVSDEKPFIELDWHLAMAFCQRCNSFVELDILQRVGYCPYCGVLNNGQKCMNRGATFLAFNRIVHDHPCSCVGCKYENKGMCKNKCILVTTEP